jgi:hypothetical protein
MVFRARFFASPPQQDDHERRDNTDHQQADKGFVIGDCVPESKGEPHRVSRQRNPEDPASPVDAHNDPKIAQLLLTGDFTNYSELALPGKVVGEMAILQ